MPEGQSRTLTKRIVNRLAVNGEDALFWNSEISSFGIRVNSTWRKVDVVQTRANGRSRHFTLSCHVDISSDRASKDAADITVRLKVGLPPVEPEPTVVDLAELNEREYVVIHCKPNIVKHYGLMLRAHWPPNPSDHTVRYCATAANLEAGQSLIRV